MLKLVSPIDGQILRGADFKKNAVFFKDALAFYDAYKNLFAVSQNKLPNYCFWNGNYSLEGICLLFKMYSAELGFESLKLSLSYLKLIYHYIASLGNLQEMPERSAIEAEFENYRTAVTNKTAAAASEKLRIESEFGSMDEDYNKKSSKFIKQSSVSMLFNVLSLVFLLTGIFCVIAPFTLYFLSVLELVMASIVSIACVGVGVVLFLIFKKLSKIFDAKESGVAYEAQRSKRLRKEKYSGYEQMLASYADCYCEKYECEHNLANSVFGAHRLTFDQIIEKANQYSILSYNIKRDAILMFKNQEIDVDGMLKEIYALGKDSSPKALQEVYEKIEDKDWLYNSLAVRYAFIDKFIEVAEKTLRWNMGSPSAPVLPFGLMVKEIAKEPIAFLKNREALFVSSGIDKFIKSSYFKKLGIFSVSDTVSSQDVKRLVLAYSTKFFDYESIKSYNNIFYDKKIGKGVRVPEEIIDKYAKIPTLVFIKLRLLILKSKMENADDESVLRLTSHLFAEDEVFIADSKLERKVIEIDANGLAKSAYELDDVAVIDSFSVKYKKGANYFVGYRVE